MLQFTAAIYKLGINPVVDPPVEVLAAIFEQVDRSRGPIPVCGTLNGTSYIQTLVKYRGSWRLYINGPMLKAAGLKVGDTANVEIAFDPVERCEPMPKELETALAKNKRAAATYDALTPSRRKEILRYLGFLKSSEALTRNIKRVIRTLSGDKTSEPPVFMERRKSSS